MTVLVEDYFQVGAFEKLIQERKWGNFEPRYEENTRKALDLLEQHDTKATFFVLGWIADQNPALVREIADRGHEVASRGYYHRSLKNLTPDELRDDIRRTNAALERATGKKVIGYRSAEKLAFDRDEWVLDILAEEGFVYDASFMPARANGNAKRFAREMAAGERSIWEFPYSTLDLKVGLLPISGGNYIRQIPFSLLKHAIRNWDRRFDSPFVFYFHVWELDPLQPRISAATYYNRVRHYRKLDKMEWVLKESLEEYRFCGVADMLGEALKLEPTATAAISPHSDDFVSAGISHSGPTTDVSIVIPCYNEQETLPYLAKTLRGLETHLRNAGYDASFIFVDDKSTDDTLSALESIFGSDDKVTILRHAANKGVAGAIMTGIGAAKTEIVCSMDCDCTYDPLELAHMIPLLRDDIDMVTASPYHRDGGVRNVPGWRLFLSKGASFLYRRTLNAKLDTYTSCFRVYRRSSVTGLELKETGFLGVAEMLGRLDINGGQIVEFPAVLEVRLFGISKMKTVRTIAGHVKLLSRLAKMRMFRKKDAIETSLPEENLEMASEKIKGHN